MGSIKIHNKDAIKDMVIFCAASIRNTVSEESISEIKESLTYDKALKIVNNVLNSSHTQPLEHVVFQFELSNYPTVLEYFLIQFKHITPTIKSRRYVDFSNMKSKYDNRFGIFSSEKVLNRIDEILEGRLNNYRMLVQAGVKCEDAREILPLNTPTTISLTVNLTELRNILHQATLPINHPYTVKFASDVSYLLQKEYGIQIFNVNGYKLTNTNYWSENDNIFTDYMGVWKILTLSQVEKITPINEILNDKNVNKLATDISSSKGNHPFRKKTNHRYAITKINGDPFYFLDKTYINNPNGPNKMYFGTLSFAGMTHILRHRSIKVAPLPLCGLSPTIPSHSKLPIEYQELFKNHMEDILGLIDLIAEEESMTNLDIMRSGIIQLLTLMGSDVYFFAEFTPSAASHFCALRLCSRAQGEIRKFAELVAKDFSDTHPLDLVPSCELLDGCPEGKKFTCKRKPLL